MLTEIWESDPFTEKKQEMVDTLSTDYYWNTGDIIVYTRGGGLRLFRVLHVEVEVSDDGLKREILALRV